MSTKTIKTIWPIALLDVLAFVLIYYLPALSHLTPIPFYLIEPLRLMVLTSLVIMQNKHNALLLAITLPLFSYFITAHPLFAKSVLISIELVLNVVVYSILCKRIKTPFIVLLLSILTSKVFYYLLKFLFIHCGFLSTNLVSTSLLIQGIVALITALLLSCIQNKKLQ